MLPGSTREAFKRGLEYEAKLGANPFKFGLIGSTDAHTSLSQPPAKTISSARSRSWSHRRNRSASMKSSRALAWSRARRSAVPRGTSRVGCGGGLGQTTILAKRCGMRWRTRKSTQRPAPGYDGAHIRRLSISRPPTSIVPDFATNGYAKGVPMGGDLARRPPAKSPVLIVRAMRDPDGANLDRVQIIKGGWAPTANSRKGFTTLRGRGIGNPGTTASCPGRQHCQCCGGDIHQHDRCGDADGVLADPAFEASRARVLLCPPARDPDAALDDVRREDFRCEQPTGVPASIQERAYTSPIWYTP